MTFLKKLGLKWSSKYIQENYANDLFNFFKKYTNTETEFGEIEEDGKMFTTIYLKMNPKIMPK